MKYETKETWSAGTAGDYSNGAEEQNGGAMEWKWQQPPRVGLVPEHSILCLVHNILHNSVMNTRNNGARDREHRALRQAESKNCSMLSTTAVDTDGWGGGFIASV